LLSERKIADSEEPLAHAVFSFTGIQDRGQAIPGFANLDWETHRLPPPTNLVVVLQHFVI
jgi:hypothetical protein